MNGVMCRLRPVSASQTRKSCRPLNHHAQCPDMTQLKILIIQNGRLLSFVLSTKLFGAADLFQLTLPLGVALVDGAVSK